MATVTIPTTGTGGSVNAPIMVESNAVGMYQLIKLVDSNVGSLDPVGTSANPLNVQQRGGPWTFIGSVGMTQVGSLQVQGDIAAGSFDSAASFPVKIGGFTVTSAFPTAQSSGTRAQAMFDRSGRLLHQPFAPATMRQCKWGTTTNVATGAVVWSLSIAGGRIIVTDYKIAVGSSIGGIVTLYFAKSGPILQFTSGSGTCLFQGEFLPGSGASGGSGFSRPMANFAYTFPEVGDPNDAVRLSVSASMQVYWQVGGFELV
jgi:hypothetical protein